jgi:uncharacterized protein
MEKSRYNIAVKEGNEYIVFNSLNSSLALMSEEAYDLYERNMLEEGSSNLQKMVNSGFLLNDEKYELNIQEKCFEEDQRNHDLLTICIVPTYACNYQCPYCYERKGDYLGSMSSEVQEAFISFVKNVYESRPYKELAIQWFGGEPTLCMDIIEQISRQLVCFCEDKNIKYSASMLSNAGLITKEVASVLKSCKINTVRPTMDGLGDLHRARRKAKGEIDSYEATLTGMRNLRDAGINVTPSMNMDWRSIDDFRILRKKLYEEEGLLLTPSQLKDYNHDFGCNSCAFSCGDFNLFSREEYSNVLFDLFEETPYTADVLKEMLSPTRVFCHGQTENYFVIDMFGDVYKCDGQVGDKEHCYFNILDEYDLSTSFFTLGEVPTKDEKCSKCAVMPICKGGCACDRQEFDEACHTMKYTIEKYLSAYRKCFGLRKEDIDILVKPINVEKFHSASYDGEGSQGSSSSAGLYRYAE